MKYYSPYFGEIQQGYAEMDDQTFAVKGKLPNTDDIVHVSAFKSKYKDKLKGKDTQLAKVVQLDYRGQPAKLMLPDGEIIDVVGLILQLLNLIERIILAVKALFSKEAQAKRKQLQKLK
jgi:hypothetical protein